MSDDAQTQTPDAPVQRTSITVEAEEPKPDRMAEKFAEMRERVEAGQGILPREDEAPAEPVEAEGVELEVAEEEAPAAELPEGFHRQEDGRVRGPDGKFWSAEQIAELEADGEAEGEAAEAEGATEPQDDDEEVIEESGEEGEPFVLQLPGRRPDDPDLEVPLEGLDQDEIEAFNRLRNGYRRGEEARTQLERATELRGEVEDFQVALQSDPIGFITSEVPQDLRVDLVKHLLVDQDTYEAVVSEVARWDNDRTGNTRRAAVAELRAKRLEDQDRARQQSARIRAARDSVRVLTHALDAAAGELTPGKAEHFRRNAVRDLKEHARRQQTDVISLEEARSVLKDTLGLFGLTPDALAAPAPGQNGASPQDAPARSARSDEPAEKRRVQKASRPDDGPRFAKKAQAKRRATASAPTGGPAPSATPFKKGDRVEDRIQIMKDRLKKGGSLRSLISGG